jgi:hypothetical protein
MGMTQFRMKQAQYRSAGANRVEIDLRDPPPVIGIPLRAGKPDLPVALQPLMDRVYRNGRFPIDYGKPPEPPLEGEDAVWAAELLGRVK